MEPAGRIQLSGLLAPLNDLARPLIKAGLGGPCLTPLGLVVAEVRGRNTGTLREVPLLALRVQDYVVVGTVQQRANWLANLSVQQHCRLWVNGRERGAAVMQLEGLSPESMPRRIATAVDATLGARYRYLVLELIQDALSRSVGETTTPLASA